MNRIYKTKPFTADGERVPELTLRALVLGIVLVIIMTAANAYLGLYAGMTVSASIPAAVVSMALLRMLLKHGSILENNIVQTMASAGESLAAGIIFTVPALLLVGVWNEFKFWPTTLIAIAGGLLGVIFMIPLRKALIVEEDELVYPEGVACAEVLIAGQTGGGSFMAIVKGFAVGGAFKLMAAMGVLKSELSYAHRGTRSVHFFGGDVSPALMAVGYIVNLEVALLIFVGGAAAWLVGIPLLGIPQEMAGSEAVDLVWSLWSGEIRYVGVGAMIVGGLWSIVSVRKGIGEGLKGLKRSSIGSDSTGASRTARDMNPVAMGCVFMLALLIMFLLYEHLTASFGMSVLATALMAVAAFFFVAVSSYIVGLVGSSNNPVSGMTICTLLGVSAVLLLLGGKGDSAILSTLGIAGVVCCAACSAGDVSQDLKTGHLLGATPANQQYAQLIGIVVPAFTIAPVLTLLHAAYGIGEGLKAPQATLFASITKAMFGEGRLPFRMIWIGVLVGLALIVVDCYLRKRKSKFRVHVMPVAVGMYLPLTLAVPILVGGVIRHFVERRSGAGGIPDSQDRGVLTASGMIAGEALLGISIAVLIVLNVNMKLPISGPWPDILSIAAFIVLAIFLAWNAAKRNNERS